MEGAVIMQTTIVKWGNSQGIRLPKFLLESANLTDNDTVDVIAENGNIIIKKSESKKTHKTIQERFKNWDGKPYELTDEDKEWLNMTPAGKEL